MDQETSLQCTLEPRQAASQLTEWVDAREQALSSEALNNGVRITFPAALQESLQALASRESICCAFLDITVDRVGEHVVVEVVSKDSDALPMIRHISGGSST